MADVEYQLVVCDTRIEQFDARATDMGLKGTVQYEAQVIRARRSCDQLLGQPAELRPCAREAWSDLSAAVDSALVDLTDAVEQAERYLPTKTADTGLSDESRDVR